MWTPPRDWVYNEIVSEAEMNIHLRDNLNETVPGKTTGPGQQPWSIAANSIVMVPNAKVRNNALTIDHMVSELIPDDQLIFPMGANEWYSVRIFVYIYDPNHQYGSIAWTKPTGCTGWGTYTRLYTHTTLPVGGLFNTLDISYLSLGDVSIADMDMELHLVIKNGASAGNFQIWWGAGGLNGTLPVVQPGTHMLIDRLK